MRTPYLKVILLILSTLLVGVLSAQEGEKTLGKTWKCNVNCENNQ
jgi:hypothetical protein